MLNLLSFLADRKNELNLAGVKVDRRKLYFIDSGTMIRTQAFWSWVGPWSVSWPSLIQSTPDNLDSQKTKENDQSYPRQIYREGIYSKVQINEMNEK